MRQLLYLFFFCLLITSCNNKGDDNDVLSASKMQVVLSDLMKADQFISDFRVPHDTAMDRDAESIKLYQQVFKLHGIDKNQFEKSLAYYQSRPDLLKVIMDSISKAAIVNAVQTTPAKDSANRSKDSTLNASDSTAPRKKKILLKNK